MSHLLARFVLCVASLFCVSNSFARLSEHEVTFLSAPPKSASYKVPYYLKLGIPVVSVSINGKKPMYFLLSSYSEGDLLIEPWAVKELNPPANGGEDLKGSLKSAYLNGSGKPLKLDFANAVVASTGLDESLLKEERIGGVIKQAFFKRYVVRYETADKRLTLYPKGAAPAPAKNAITLPFLFGEKNRPFSLTVKINGKETAVSLGENNAVSSLPAGDTAVSTLLISDETVVIGSQTSDKTTLREALLPSLNIGGRGERNVPVTVSTSVIGRLGFDFLRRFDWMIDVPNRTLTLVPARDYAEVSRVPGVAGTTVVERDGKLLLGLLDPTGAISKAGGVPGDVITAIDNVKVSGRKAREVEEILNGKAGAKATLYLNRAGKNVNVSFVRANPY